MKVKGTFRTTTDVEIVTMDAWDDIRRRVLKQYKADHPHVHKDANRINRNGLWMYDDPHSGHYSQDEIYGEATDADKAFMKHLDVIASLLLKHERQSS